MIELRGEKVRLRTLERVDCHKLWEAYEPIVPLPTEPLNPGLSIEKADDWFEEIQNKQGKEQLYLGVFTTDGELIGDIQLSGIDWRHRSANLGLSIARSADRRKGYGLDATLTLLAYAFQQLDIYRVSAVIISFNAPAEGILEKCGFVKEGQEREAIYSDGQRWDLIRYGLLRPEYQVS